MRFYLTVLSILLVSGCIGQDFGDHNQLSINHGYWDLLSIDFDMDGDIDQVTANAFVNNVSWISNEGSFNYSEEHILFEINIPRKIEQLDVNGDSFLDILVSSESDGIFWAQNNGNNLFQEIHLLTPDAGASTVKYADVDLDSDYDVIAGFPESDDIRLYTNDGTGVFSVGTIIVNTINNIHALDWVDLNGDNYPDITCAAKGSNSSVRLLLNNGDGTFADAVFIPFSSNNPSVLDHADLDNDGDLDIALGAQAPSVSWAENAGDGSFPIIHPLSLNGYWGVAPSDMVIVDLNNDGFAEIATFESSYSQFRVQYYENQTDGNFSWNNTIQIGLADTHGSMEAADLNGDGTQELIKCSLQGDEIGFYQTNPYPFFSGFEIISDVADNVSNPAVIDIDGDLDMDIVTCFYLTNSIAVFLNDGLGNFSTPQVLSEQIPYPTSCYAEDLDNDGDMDLVVTSQTNDFLYILQNLGNGTFNSPVNLIANPNISTTLDADQDQDLDILVSTSENSQTILLLNDGFYNQWEEVVLINGSNDFRVGDIDSDGDDDVIVMSGYGNATCYLLRNMGLAQFENESIASNLLYSHLLNLEDIDDNGSLDILITTYYGVEKNWMSNDGLGNFGAVQSLDVGNIGISNFQFVDMDLDGDKDLISPPMPNEEGLFLFSEKLGPAEYMDHIVVPMHPSMFNPLINGYSITTNDVNGDSYPDVVYTAEYTDEIVWLENTVFNGCTDPLACNYSSGNSVDDGSCCYGICGCSDPAAYNYQSNVDCSEPSSCTYLFTGHVFFDENENGIKNPEENNIPNEQVSWNGIISETNESGNFTFVMPLGYQIMHKIPSLELPNLTNSNPKIFNLTPLNLNGLIGFGVSDELPDYFFGGYLAVYHFFPSLPCDSLIDYHLRFMCLGEALMEAVIELEFDTLFQDFDAPLPIDSIVGNTVYMHILPGNGLLYDIPFNVLTPEAENFGATVSVEARITGYYLNEPVFYREDSFTNLLTCSYDPNMKQATPHGYTDDHFILHDDPIEYTIHFQNTGNAPATNVLIRDTIDGHLDLSTFELTGHSHSVGTNIHPETRVIEFYFLNIMLPDSVNDEPNSHGLVSYTLQPQSNLDYGTTISNTANIYFDNNSPIVTNTTWHTIYYCNPEISSIEGEAPVLLGETFTLFNSQELIETYSWTLNGEQLGTDPLLEYALENCGEQYILLEVANPICIAQDSIEVNLPIPEASFNQSEWELNAIEASSWQWYFNGDPIPDSNYQTFTVNESGNYFVEVFNEYGCSNFSDTTFVLYINMTEKEQPKTQIYPNPTNDLCMLLIQTEETGFPVLVQNIIGEKVLEFIYENSNGQLFKLGSLPPGKYLLTFELNQKRQAIPIIVE